MIIIYNDPQKLEVATSLLGVLCYLFLDAMRILSVRDNIFLRKRRFWGVTSRISSSAKNSRHCSKDSLRGGTNRSASSEPDARILETCFFLQTLTDIFFHRDR